jgi:hypothetical protein
MDEIVHNRFNTTPNRVNNVSQSMSSVISTNSDRERKGNSVSQIKNRESIMKVFVSDIENLNAVNECGWTPLYRTIIGANNKATAILLKYGANPNIKCNVYFV